MRTYECTSLLSSVCRIPKLDLNCVLCLFIIVKLMMI